MQTRFMSFGETWLIRSQNYRDPGMLKRISRLAEDVAPKQTPEYFPQITQIPQITSNESTCQDLV